MTENIKYDLVVIMKDVEFTERTIEVDNFNEKELMERITELLELGVENILLRRIDG